MGQGFSDKGKAKQPASTGGGTDGREVQIQNNGTHIQWRYVGDSSWINIVALASLRGSDGTNGTSGTNGRQVEFNKSSTHIQWRYVGDTSWINLVPLTDIKGADGSAGISMGTATVNIPSATREYTATITVPSATTSSKISAFLSNGDHTQENFGVPVSLHCIAGTGQFSLIITPVNPAWELKGNFYINYIIQ